MVFCIANLLLTACWFVAKKGPFLACSLLVPCWNLARNRLFSARNKQEASKEPATNFERMSNQVAIGQQEACNRSARSPKPILMEP